MNSEAACGLVRATGTDPALAFAETQAVPKVGAKPVPRLRRIREAVKAIKSPEV